MNYVKILLDFHDAELEKYYQQMNYWSKEYDQGLYNESRTLIRFNALVSLFSFGYFHVHTVFMSFLSLCGLVGIYKTFLPFFKNKKKELFVSVFLIPSVLFWGSSVLKEGLILFSMGMLIYHFHKAINKKFSTKRFLLIVFFLGLLFFTKLYILLIVLPALLANAWIVKTGFRMPEIKYIFVFTAYFFIGFNIPDYDIRFMLMEKQKHSIHLARGGSYLGNEKVKRFVYIKPEIKDRIVYLKDRPDYCKIKPGVPYIDWAKENFSDTNIIESSVDTNTYWVYFNMDPAGSKIDIPILYPNIWSIIKNSPVAFVSTFFRPHIFEMKNALMGFPAIENFIILLLLILSIVFFVRKIEHRHLFYFCLSIVFLLFILTSIATPILGAIVRYKVPALPFLLIALLFIFDKEKFLKKFPFFQKKSNKIKYQ
ncbi:MAG: hypothetical protein V1781_08980 [Bacteroidota bacterium]